MNRVANLYHLLKQLRFLFVPSGGIDYDNIETLLLKLSHTLSSNRNRVGLRVRAVVCHLSLGSRLSRLIEGTRSECVSADNRTSETAFLVVHSELRASRGFAVALQWEIITPA